MARNKRLTSGWWDILPSGKFTPKLQDGGNDALHETMIFKPFPCALKDQIQAFLFTSKLCLRRVSPEQDLFILSQTHSPSCSEQLYI
jgi:hypothetical protein